MNFDVSIDDPKRYDRIIFQNFIKELTEEIIGTKCKCGSI